MKIIATLAGVIVALLFAMSLAAYLLQEKLIFHPTTLPPTHKYQFPFPFEEVNFEVETGVNINAIHAKTTPSKGLVLYFHGNAGNLDGWGWVAQDFTKCGYDLLIIDYRGFGKSTGKITSEQQLQQDADFIYQQLLKQYTAGDIIIYGRSIGTGIASWLASKYTPKLLLLETPYINFHQLAKHYSPIVLPIHIKYELANDKHAINAKCPVHIFHGTEDEIVPYNHGKRLSELSNNIHLTTIIGGTHNNLPEKQEYQSVIASLLNQ